MRAPARFATIRNMVEHTLTSFSDQLADAVAAAAPSVVQVQGRRRPASGVVYASGVVVTTGRAIGREEGLVVRTPDGVSHDAQLAGWDPVTHLAVLRVPAMSQPAATVADSPARVGHLAIAVGRSWSNAITASVGNVAVIGGPLPTGRGRAIDEVIRTTAPMHQGFAGGAFADTSGRLIGIATAAEIRGLGVIIPAAIAWKAAQDLLEHGALERGYLGVAAQPVRLPARQRGGPDAAGALLVVAVTEGSPAEAAGLLVGDVLLAFDGAPVDSPERLLEMLSGERVGQTVRLTLLRGGAPIESVVSIAERKRSR
jgi:S1-C subfamily serine protease